MKSINKGFGIRIIAKLIFAVCGIFLIVSSTQAVTKKALPLAPREVRVVTQNAVQGQTVTVVIETDAAGDESVYGFTLNYNTAVLTYVPNSVAIGSGATRQAGGSCDLLENAETAGRIGFSIDCNASTITAGNARQLATMRFTVASNAALGSTPLTFTDTPTRRVVASSPRAGTVTSLPTTFSDGFVRINAASTTAALVEVSGKVSLPRGTAISNAVVQLNNGGETLTTRTNAFGRYSFKVSAGETYVISVSHKRYQFASRAVSISETIQDLNFTAEK